MGNGISATYKMRYDMKTVLAIIFSGLVGASFAEGVWSPDRLESFLRGSCRFIESDCDETDASDDMPGRMRDAFLERCFLDQVSSRLRFG